MFHWLPQCVLFFILVPFFSYRIKASCFQSVAFKVKSNMWRTKALCAIKNALFQTKADNFVPAMREIKGQDRCWGKTPASSPRTSFLRSFVLASLHSPFRLVCTLLFLFHCMIQLHFRDLVLFFYFSIPLHKVPPQSQPKWHNLHRHTCYILSSATKQR